jgi:hypothetical protein
LSFEIDDAESLWTYPPDYFDFIHIRGLTGCIKDWNELYVQAYEHLAPGGWVEQLEFEVETNADKSSGKFADQIMTAFSNSITKTASEKTGKSFSICPSIGSSLRNAGFVDIKETKFIWPIGAWPKDPHLKDLGRWGERNWSEGVEGWVMALYTRLLGWSYEEVQAFVKDFRGVIRDRKNRFYHEVRVVYGRKPFEHEVEEMRRKKEKEGGEADAMEE